MNHKSKFFKMKKCLLITLGHNSSAIYTDGDKIIGYEEERLNRVKSSSNFPRLSILEILKNLSGSKFESGLNVYISHWFDDLRFITTNNAKKYFDLDFLNSVIIRKYNIETVDSDFTHHDAHAYSSLAFFKENYQRDFTKRTTVKKDEKIHFIVADGFGNNQEVISIYSSNWNDVLKNNIKRIHTSYGYSNSLGLMYQYATSFCGMKENQDEYKFLGYESHILEVVDDISYLDFAAICQADLLFKNFLSSFVQIKQKEETSNIIDIEKLLAVKNNWHMHFAKLIFVSDYDIKDFECYEARCIIGYYIQRVIEQYMNYIIDYFEIKNIVLSGGLFYNVKLNNSILKKVTGVTCVMPIAGDQGAAIGLYQKFVGDFHFKDMCFGLRRKTKIETDVFNNIYVLKEEEAIDKIIELLNADRIVNIVYKNMEFGPRALCHTSTIALPFKDNVNNINQLNSRNDVMPMAPVICEHSLIDIFDENYLRVIGSDKYMVITYDYRDNYLNDDSPITIDGVSHKYPTSDMYSGRPQVVSELSFIGKIIQKGEYEVLINTSFNIHGQPIVFSDKDIEENFNYQLKQSREKEILRPYLIIIK